MPEKTRSVQVDAAAHARVEKVARVLGSTQSVAASLLIEVADVGAVVRRHQEAVAQRLRTELQEPARPGSPPVQAGS